MEVKQDFRELLCVAVPKGLGGILQVAINFALLRYLGPAEFGLLSVPPHEHNQKVSGSPTVLT